LCELRALSLPEREERKRTRVSASSQSLPVVLSHLSCSSSNSPDKPVHHNIFGRQQGDVNLISCYSSKLKQLTMQKDALQSQCKRSTGRTQLGAVHLPSAGHDARRDGGRISNYLS